MGARKNVESASRVLYAIIKFEII
jgi:hypothetical protein